MAVLAIVQGVPTLWPLPEWFIPTLGLAGLIGTGLDLTAWRNTWGRPRGNGIWVALGITGVSLLAGTLGFLEISRLSIAGAGWSFRATGATIGAIVSAMTGIGALGGWWRLFILDRVAFPALSQRQSLEDGLRCIGQSVVIALLLGVIVRGVRRRDPRGAHQVAVRAAQSRTRSNTAVCRASTLERGIRVRRI